MGKDYKLYLTLNRDTRKIDIMVEESKAEAIIMQAEHIFDAVNRRNYSGRLNFKYDATCKKFKTRQTRSLKAEDQAGVDTKKIKGAKGKKTVEVKKKPALETPQEKVWIEFFTREEVGFSPELATKYTASLIEDGTAAPWSLKNLLESFRKDNEISGFRQYLRDDIGVSAKNVQKIIAGLEDVPSKKPKSFAYGFFGGENLQHSEIEKEKIHFELLKSHLDAKLTKPIPPLRELKEATKYNSKTKEKILHLGMHGHVKRSDGNFTLGKKVI